MKKAFIYFILFISIFSCNEKHENTYLVETTKELKFKLPNNVNSTPRTTRYFNSNNQGYLAISNKSDNGIYFFNIKNQELTGKTIFEKEGPNGIGSLLGFEIYNFDSIYISSKKYFNSIFIADTNASILHNIDFGKIMNEGMFFRAPYLQNSINSTIHSDKVGFTTIFLWMGNYDSFYELNNFRIGYQYCYNDEKKTKVNTYFPKLSKKIIPSFYSNTFSKDAVILSFLRDNHIYVSKNGESFIRHKCKSFHFNKGFKSNASEDMLEGVKAEVETPKYLSILYDKYRHVYYRFFYPGITVTKKDNLMEMSEFKRKFSIMIIDDDYNVIGETLFPENKYFINSYFINPEGLWLSTNHINNPDFDPDYLKFELLKLNTK